MSMDECIDTLVAAANTAAEKTAKLEEASPQRALQASYVNGLQAALIILSDEVYFVEDAKFVPSKAVRRRFNEPDRD